MQFAGTDRLKVPTDKLDRVTKYRGMGEASPTLSRLGTQEWTRTKARVKESVEAVARELLELYRFREKADGHAFAPDNHWQRELEAAFPYEETPDQEQAIKDVKADMESPRPMDRLVCGDVGYGKTEVAIRAAFKAVMDGKQVAVLVPTTVLAQQHYNTFRERMQAFPVRVGVLSRFHSRADQLKVLEGARTGTVDIVVGTHRLLQKDVSFKNLGLLVIDEEQRFGVKHKEQLKQLRRDVDVLTLTATPIPRSLHMALVQVRDLSVIATPPEGRLPIKTFLEPFDEYHIREAILRELDRGGQVYFMHNRVQTIEAMAERLRFLVPKARLASRTARCPKTSLNASCSISPTGRTIFWSAARSSRAAWTSRTSIPCWSMTPPVWPVTAVSVAWPHRPRQPDAPMPTCCTIPTPGSPALPSGGSRPFLNRPSSARAFRSP